MPSFVPKSNLARRCDLLLCFISWYLQSSVVKSYYKNEVNQQDVKTNLQLRWWQLMTRLWEAELAILMKSYHDYDRWKLIDKSKVRCERLNWGKIK